MAITAEKQDKVQEHAISTTTVKPKTKVSNNVHFIAGGVGGAVAAICTCPLEVLKTRLQVENFSNGLQSAKSGMLGTRLLSSFMDIWTTEGVRGLWRGLGPNLVGVAPSRAIYFLTYNGSKNLLTNTMHMEDSDYMHFSAAVLAGLCVITSTSPLWLIKTRMQLQSNLPGKYGPPYKNSFDCIKRVYREEGIRGFYKGLVASYVGISETALQFMLYEKFKYSVQLHKMQKNNITNLSAEQAKAVQLSGFEYLATASIAKLIASIATYPHEVVRTRMREQRAATIESPHKYNGFLQALKLIAREEGRRGLYGGMGAHLMRVVPNAAIMFYTYEQIVRIMSD